MAVAGFLIIAVIYLLFELLMFKNKISVYFVLIAMCAVILTVTQIFGGGVTLADWTTVSSTGPIAMASGTCLFILYGAFGGILKVFGVIDEFVKWTINIAKSKGPALIIAMLIVTSIIAVLGGGGFALMALAVPVLLALGIDKKYATVFMVQIACISYFLTVTIYPLITPVTGLGMQDLTTMAFVCAGAMLVTSIIFIIYVYKKTKPVIDEQAFDEIMAKGGAPKFKITYLLPLVPVFFIWVLKLDAYTTFIISIVFALVLCGLMNRTKLEDFTGMVGKSFVTGLSDVSGLVTINVILGMMVIVAKLESVSAMFNSAIGTIMPESKIGMFLVIGALMVVGCAYRGVGNLTGLGFGICLAIMALPTANALLVSGIMMAITTMGLLGDPCVAYAMYASSLSKFEHTSYFKTAIIPASACALVVLAAAMFLY